MKKINRKPKIRKLFNEQGGKCAYCHVDMTLDLGYDNTATIDHVIPQKIMKISNEFNEVASCLKCNQDKSDKPFYKFIGNKLRK